MSFPLLGSATILFTAAQVPDSCKPSLVFLGGHAGAASGVDVSHEIPGAAKNRKTSLRDWTLRNTLHTSRPDLGTGNETATGCGRVRWRRVSCMTKISTEGAAKAQPNSGGFPGTHFLVLSSTQNVSKLEPAQSIASEAGATTRIPISTRPRVGHASQRLS